MPAVIRRGSVVVLAAMLALCIPGLTHAEPQARQAQAPPSTAVRQAAAAQPASVPVSSQDAGETRRTLERILSNYSPTVGRVLSLDPLLLQNAGYLEPYPELAAFIAQHPEVAPNTTYFFSAWGPASYQPVDRDSQMLRMWIGFFGGSMVFLSFCLVVGLLVWIVRTVNDSRRWSRLLKAQTEAHNKLLDKFGTHEELLAYISTPAGRRFLEAGPILVNGVQTSAGGPTQRILWATEVGLILACGGGGLMFARRNLPGDLPQMMWLAAVLVISLGIGFIFAAGASYLLSRRMGILGPAASHDQRTSDAHPAE